MFLMIDESCPKKKIGWEKCVISLILFNSFLFTIFFAYSVLMQNKMSILFLIEITFLLGISSQILIFIFEKHEEKKASHIDWKHPPRNFSRNHCEKKLKKPGIVKNIFFKIKPCLEFLIFYQSPVIFHNIKKGWNSAVDHRQLNSNAGHDAIIVNIYSPLSPEYMFQNGIDLLITFFMRKKNSYKIYCCNSSDNFFDIVNNPNATSLWIFGHGTRGSLRCRDKYVIYSELCNQLSPISRNKRYIYQFQCNGGSNEISLVEYLANGRGFANFKENTMGAEIRVYIQKILQDDSWNN